MSIPTFIRLRHRFPLVPIDVRRKLLKWGNGYGLRLTAKEVEAMGVLAGQTVHAVIEPAPVKNDLSAFPLFHFRPTGLTFREELDLAWDEDLAEKEQRRRAATKRAKR